MRAMHRWRRDLGLFILMLALSGAQSLADSLPAQRIVEGVGAMIESNQMEARQRALHDGLRKALEQTVADLLDIDVLVANLRVLQQQVYTRAPQYIQSYRVLWEYPDVAQKVYRLRIEVQIAVEELAQAVETLGLTLVGEAAPRLLLLIEGRQQERAEVAFPVQAERVIGQALRDQLLAQRFRLIDAAIMPAWDGQVTSALEAGKAAGADVVLVGWADVQKTHSRVAGMPIQTVQATAQIGMWETATGEQLASDRARATVDHTDAILAGKQALGKAAVQLAEQLMPSLHVYQQTHIQRAVIRQRDF